MWEKFHIIILPQTHWSATDIFYFTFYHVVKRHMITKNSVVEIKNLVVKHKSQPVESNLGYQQNLKQFIVLMSQDINANLHISSIINWSLTNWWCNTVKTHNSHYQWTYLFRRRTQAAIPTMLLQRPRYPYPERNCSQRIQNLSKDAKSIIKPDSKKTIQDSRNGVNGEIKDTKK